MICQRLHVFFANDNPVPIILEAAGRDLAVIHFHAADAAYRIQEYCLNLDSSFLRWLNIKLVISLHFFNYVFNSRLRMLYLLLPILSQWRS